MNMVQWVETVKNAPVKKTLPVLSFPGTQLIGVSVRDLVHSGELQAACMKAIADRYPTLAAVSNMDLSVEAEAFGAKAAYGEAEVPSIKGRLIDTQEDAENLMIPAVGAGRTGACVKAIEMAVRQITDRPVFAGVIGPFSLAGRLFELTEVIYKAIDEPETVHLVLTKVTKFLVEYIKSFKKAGANGIVMAEPAAGLLSPDWNAEFSAQYVKQIVTEVQDKDFMVIYHNCGKVVPMIDDIINTGAMAFHFGNTIDLTDVINRIPPDRLVMGNIDPASQFANGTPESIREVTKTLIERMKGHTNFVLSSGCDIPPQTPLINIDAFFDAAASA
jgi:uroporphyrinogen decarboxylase